VSQMVPALHHFLSSLDVEVVMVAGYALLLTVIATVLELAARSAHSRSRGFQTAGFRYLRDLDVFRCPSGEALHPVEHDRAHRLVRYRARADVCNACRLKSLCTDSDRGREVVRSTASWLDSEIGRFHRGISLALMVLAGMITAVALVRHLGHRPEEIWLLGTVLAIVVVSSVRLTLGLLHGGAEGELQASGIR